MNSSNLLYLLFLLMGSNTQVPIDPVARAMDQQFVKLINHPALAIEPGKKDTLTFFFEIDSGYHIMSDKPEEASHPTSLHLTSNQALQFGAPDFSQLVDYCISDEEPVPVFENRLTVKIPVSTTPDANHQDWLINSSLSYLACSDSKCYFPRELAFQFTIHVENFDFK